MFKKKQILSFVVLLSIGFVSCVETNGEEIYTIGEEGSKWKIKLPDENYTFIRDDNKEFYYNMVNRTLPGTPHDLLDDIVSITLVKDYHAKWKIESEKTVLNYRIFVADEKVDVIPEQTTVQVNQSIILHMPKVYDKTISCILVYEINDKQIFVNLTEKQSKLPSIHYDCGITLKIEEFSEAPVTGSFYQSVQSGKSYCGSFRLGVIEIKETIKETEIIKSVGSRHNFALEKNMNEPESCELVDPNGKRVSVSKYCEYTLNRVTVADAGIWTMYYYYPYEHMTYISKFKIIVHDLGVVTSIIENNSGTHLFCYVKHKTTKKFCSFEHPNGEIILINSKIGDDKYQYYIDHNILNGTIQDSEYCGLTIKFLNESDFGAWRCEMQLGDPEVTVGSIIHVNNKKNKKSVVAVKSPNVYTKQGDSFQLSCVASHKVKQCWMLSPNGSIFIGNEFNEYSTYKYNGRGFAMGDCGIVIKKADDVHHGDWKCQMKLENGERIESQINVIVTKNPILAKHNEIVTKDNKIIYTGSPIVMSCAVIPSETFDFDDCRWIKPDGNGIHYESDQRYRLERSQRECNLVVTDNNVEGNWTCVLESRIGKGEIHSEIFSVNVQPHTYEKYFLSIGVFSLFVVIFLMCIGFYVCRHKFRKNAPADILPMK